MYVIDFFAAVGLGALALYWHRYAMFICGFVACSPDFFWIVRVIKTKSFNLSDNQNWFTKWHVKIQRFERPWGVWVEMPLAVVLFYFVWQFGKR